MQWAKKQHGFTIVELLIVIVVIAILAAVTIVAYNGIRERAITATLQSELTQAVKKIESLKITSGTEAYPATQAAAGITASASSTINYYYNASGNTYCLQISQGNYGYVATSTTKNPAVGSCTDNSGLVAWWQLNNSTTDSTANGNNGTGSNVTSVNGQNGSANSAFGFTSGSASYIDVPSTAALSSSTISFSFWINPTSWTAATASVIMAKRTLGSNGYFIAYVNASNALIFDCGGSGQRWITNFNPPLGTWSHVVLTCSNGTGLSLAVNGVATDSRPTVSTASLNSASTLRIGQDPSAGAYTFTGSIDDVRVYDRILSNIDAQSLYTSGAR